MHSYIMGEDFATLVNVSTGNTVCVNRGDTNYDQFVSLIKAGEYDKAERMSDAKLAFESFAGTETSGLISFIINDGQAYYRYGSLDAVPLNNAIVDRILSQAAEGFNVKPMMKFMANLLSNPERTAIDELYLFLEACKLPITEDGCFIAYKIVKNDYMDIYTGTMDNSVGKVLQMQRTEVDSNRNNTCSRGLHFCSKEYLNHYGSSNRNNDRCMLVKINPADVVSIPSDYNNAKGRAWKYEVVGEVTTDEWREILSRRDYTTASVVSNKGHTLEKYGIEKAFDMFFVFDEDGECFRWWDSDRVASFDAVVKKLVSWARVSEEEAGSYLNAILGATEDEYWDDVDRDDNWQEVEEETDDCSNDCSNCQCGSADNIDSTVVLNNLRSYGYIPNTDGTYKDIFAGRSESAEVVASITGYSVSEIKSLAK